MNLYLISLLHALVVQNTILFSKLNFVRSAVILGEHNQIFIQIKNIGDIYFSFLQRIKFLPVGISKENFFIQCDFQKEHKTGNGTVNEVMRRINSYELHKEGILPVHISYIDEYNMHLVAGLAHMENSSRGFLHLVDLCLPKHLISDAPNLVAYVKEILESYDNEDKRGVRDIIKEKGYDYGKFQKDCKIFFGDSFYSFLLKLKMTYAVGDIFFSALSFKEIAYKNKFIDYNNMHKTFARYGLSLKTVPRLANL